MRLLIPVSILIIFAIMLIAIMYNTFFKGGDDAKYIYEEMKSIKAVNIDHLPAASNHFDTNLVVLDYSDGRMAFEIDIFNPKKEMKQVVVSAFLGDEILNDVNPSHSLVTNIISVKNADHSLKDQFNLIPNGPVTGISVGSEMNSFDVLKVLPHVIIKVSWIDEQNKAHEEYIKYPKDNYIMVNFTKEFMDRNQLVSSLTSFPQDALFAGINKDNPKESFIIHFTSTKAQERKKVFNFTDKGEIKFIKRIDNRMAKFNYGENQEGYIDVLTNEIIW